MHILFIFYIFVLLLIKGCICQDTVFMENKSHMLCILCPSSLFFVCVCVCVYVFCWTFIYKYLMIDIRRLASHTSSLACAKLSVPGSPLSGVPLMQIKVSSAQNLKLSKVLFLEPGVGDTVASNALPTVNSSDFVIHVCAFLVYSFFLFLTNSLQTRSGIQVS